MCIAIIFILVLVALAFAYPLVGVPLLVAFVVTMAYPSLGKRRRRKQMSEGPYPAFEIPKGKYGAKVYVYDGTMLPAGSFVLEVIPGETTMRSVYTGTEWTGLCGLSYDYAPVGFVDSASTYSAIIKQISDKYMRVTVHARRTGTSPQGWPEVTLQVPDYEWFKKGGYWPY